MSNTGSSAERRSSGARRSPVTPAEHNGAGAGGHMGPRMHDVMTQAHDVGGRPAARPPNVDLAASFATILQRAIQLPYNSRVLEQRQVQVRGGATGCLAGVSLDEEARLRAALRSFLYSVMDVTRGQRAPPCVVKCSH
ncbi:hypothetical protein Aduo_005292 [Ancylostoma duodenale]